MHYRVTILNSPAVNAFALPSGQLYVTRGLIALANDTSELASVLSHEMSHVIARHAAMREDQARQVALVSRVVHDVLSDPETGALALAKSKIALASFSRAQEFEADGIGVGIAARAGYDPYGAVRFLTSMGRNAELKSNPGQSHIDPRSPDFLSSHPATPERIKNAQGNARQFSAPGAGERDRAAYLAGIDGMVYGEDPSEGFVRGRRFLHPKLGFTFLAPEGFSLDNTAQAVLGVKEGGGQALRLDVVRVPAEQTLAEYLNSGWIENIDPKTVEEVTDQRPAGGDRHRQGRPMGVPALRGAVRKRRLSLHLRHQAHDRGDRSRLPRIGRHLPPHDAWRKARRRSRMHLKVVTVEPGDTVERLASRMATPDRAGRALPHSQRPRPRRPRQPRRLDEDRGGVSRRRARIRVPSLPPICLAIIAASRFAKSCQQPARCEVNEWTSDSSGSAPWAQASCPGSWRRAMRSRAGTAAGTRPSR